MEHPQSWGQEASTQAISTERPTLGSSPDLVPVDSLQVETGLSLNFQRSRFGADLPESLLRYGLTRRLEVRYQTSDAVFASSSLPGQQRLQTADTALSAKFLLKGPNSFAPKSMLAAINLPTGGPAWTTGSADPGLTLIWTQTTKNYFLNEVAQATLTTVAGARRAAWAPSIAAGRSVTSRLTVFAEYAPTIVASNSLVTVVDGGFTILHGNLRQLDLRAGYLQDSDGRHTLLSIGFSVRRDHLRSGLRHLAFLSLE